MVTVLDQLESDAIYILREVAGQFESPVLLFSGGKDSAVCAWLAQKAFAPAPPPFPLLHIDTGQNFPETLQFRDWFATRFGLRLIVRSVEETIACGRGQDESGPAASRNALQSVTLLDALSELQADCAIGGARRDEEKARAKERVFSHRNAFGDWESRTQPPELWELYHAGLQPGEHMRVFPLSNWTELDVWHYIAAEGVPLPSLYFSHTRRVFRRRDVLVAETPWTRPLPDEAVIEDTVRFRTVGDATCSAAVHSGAASLSEVIRETAAARTSERGGRLDDQRSEGALEERKRRGYF